MAANDDKPGLLSRVVMFVRNPTKDGSAPEQASAGAASGYDKQALKYMIERKRQNDFVRKREFDQLRRMRNRDVTAMDGVGKPPLFQTSLPSDQGERADTLKKIDAIEAQMSGQWWEGKNEGAPPPEPLLTGSHARQLDPPPSEMFPSDSELSAPFPATELLDLRPTDSADCADEFMPTQVEPGMVSMTSAHAPGGHAASAGAHRMHSTAWLLATPMDALETDLELEEAAIRFANSDDAGAEKGLLAVLRSNVSTGQLALAWSTALLDLYRASDNRCAFEAAVHEFAQQLDGARPTWFALADPPALLALVADAARAASDTCIWSSPARLAAQDMEQLRQAMESSPMPWHLGWCALESIAPDAVPLLEALFGGLCEDKVSLRLEGEDRLVHALRGITPSGQRHVSQSCWTARLNALRAMCLHDDFELASLDYCVTYGAPPQPWREPRCSLELSGQSSGGRPPSGPEAVAPQGGLESSADQAPVQLLLQGQLSGDAAQALSVLDNADASGGALHVSCRSLIRVDFAAAGSILNWVTLRHAEGKRVQFQEVHRLVAALFNVIGINECAKVLLRPV